MSLFDYFRPAKQSVCPGCGRVLSEWQGKDGPNGLFIWSEGTAYPVEQAVPEEVQIDESARMALRLPERFTIYSYDCPDHRPIFAECRATSGVWSGTNILAQSRRGQK
jgi:hypothetical protein